MRRTSKILANLLLHTSALHRNIDYISHSLAIFDVGGSPEGQSAYNKRCD